MSLGALGYQRRRESQFRWIRQQIDEGALGKLVNAEANISRDRLGQFERGPQGVEVGVGLSRGREDPSEAQDRGQEQAPHLNLTMVSVRSS